jgi:hypothetical protein
VISQLSPKNADGLFDYRVCAFDIMIYLKMLFEPKNLKRKQTYYSHVMSPSEYVDVYTLDRMRDIGLSLFTRFDTDALTFAHFQQIFKEFTNIKISEQEVGDTFSIIDTNMDSLIGSPF